jgi:hypothetical protein
MKGNRIPNSKFNLRMTRSQILLWQNPYLLGMNNLKMEMFHRKLSIIAKDATISTDKAPTELGVLVFGKGADWALKPPSNALI